MQIYIVVAMLNANIIAIKAKQKNKDALETINTLKKEYGNHIRIQKSKVLVE